MKISGTTGIDLSGLPINNSGNAEVEGLLTVGGNVGIGTTPNAWTTYKAIDLGTNASISEGYGNVAFSSNCYGVTGGTFKYKNNGYATRLNTVSGNFEFFTAPSGTAGNTITWTNAMLFNKDQLDLTAVQLNVYGASVNNTFEFVQRTAGKGFDWYVNGGSNRAMILDSSGNVLLISGTGGLGYGPGAGGAVTQLTSKSTAVTLNKPSGQIIMNNAALAAGVSAVFAVNNTIITDKDTIIVNINNGSNGDRYDLFVWFITSGTCYLRLKNISASSLSDALVINFTVIKGANS